MIVSGSSYFVCTSSGGGRYSRAWLRPRVLAWYMAVSAHLASCTSVLPCSGYMAMPWLLEMLQLHGFVVFAGDRARFKQRDVVLHQALNGLQGFGQQVVG